MIGKNEIIALFKKKYPEYRIGSIEKKGYFYIFTQALDFEHPENMVTPGYPIKYNTRTNEFSHIIEDEPAANDYGFTVDELDTYLDGIES